MKGKTGKWFRFCNMGYEEPVFVNFREEIVLQNSRMVLVTSFIGSFIMYALTLAALFVSSVSRVLPLYLFTAVVFTLIYFLVKLTSEKNAVISLFCNYAFLTAAFIFAIGLDIIQGNVTATTVCVLLVALPLLIVDRPYRVFLYFLAVSLVFMYESAYIKQSPKASIDILNAFSFLGVGTFLGYKHNQMVFRNFINQFLLKQQRDTDTLTNLYNKGALEAMAETILGRENARASMIVIDMDNFKYVNDTFGHHAGDELLAKIGTVLTSLFRSSDLVSRFGGDEFVVFLPENVSREMLKMRAERILQGVNEIRLTADPDYRAHICMGIASFPQDGGSYEEVFRSADAAMYLVKKNGKNGFGFYDANAKPKILVVDDIETNRAILKAALNQEFEILEAEDGHQALSILKETPDIVMLITDIQMPNMDGIELIRQVRSESAFRELAVIANTQYGDMKQEEQLFGLGVDDFVYKAAMPLVIRTRVKNVLKVKEEG